ncbi:hypothetical protein SKAU_G00091850 [Synaphobranchus kaupii]|uniref:Uncharacterized protein n=1 Tax=Synaphobranchus kaupii TaxID=118154 RepID=A0A9Q1FXB8_SYNKA|nr:hypothetical protein SKAU_G00091850 [Synaphobranchus kaupii]
MPRETCLGPGRGGVLQRLTAFIGRAFYPSPSAAAYPQATAPKPRRINSSVIAKVHGKGEGEKKDYYLSPARRNGFRNTNTRFVVSEIKWNVMQKPSSPNGSQRGSMSVLAHDQ